jgi:hypothetical protein
METYHQGKKWIWQSEDFPNFLKITTRRYYIQIFNILLHFIH